MRCENNNAYTRTPEAMLVRCRLCDDSMEKVMLRRSHVDRDRLL